MTALVRTVGGKIAAEVNWGRWIAPCTRCDSALQVTPNVQVVECWGCGLISELVWPDEAMRHGVTRLLLMRPNPKHRNWSPGETLIDLMVENGAHGIFSDLPPIEPGRSAFAVEEGRIMIDELTALTGYRRLEVTR